MRNNAPLWYELPIHHLQNNAGVTLRQGQRSSFISMPVYKLSTVFCDQKAGKLHQYFMQADARAGDAEAEFMTALGNNLSASHVSQIHIF